MLVSFRSCSPKDHKALLKLVIAYNKYEKIRVHRKSLSQGLLLGARNLKGVELLLNNEVHPYDLLRYERAIFSAAAIEQLTTALEKAASKRKAAAKEAA